jgi:hypothetical protein
MYAVELDQSKRLLVITGAQRVTADQARQAAQQVRELLQGRCARVPSAGGLSVVTIDGSRHRASCR